MRAHEILVIYKWFCIQNTRKNILWFSIHEILFFFFSQQPKLTPTTNPTDTKYRLFETCSPWRTSTPLSTLMADDTRLLFDIITPKTTVKIWQYLYSFIMSGLVKKKLSTLFNSLDNTLIMLDSSSCNSLILFGSLYDYGFWKDWSHE